MGAFVLSIHDVLSIAISINVCTVLQQMLTSRLVRWLVPFISKRSSRGRNLFIIQQRWPNLLGRILTEQITLFILLTLILVNLGFVSSPILPFREHKSSEYHQLTRIVISASTARFLVIALNILFPSTDVVPSCNDSDVSRINIRGSSGHTKSAGWHFLYCAFSIVSNVLGLGYKQNLLLLGTSSFMELNTTSLVVCRLIKLADRHRGCQSYFKMSILCCAVCLFSRVFLPGLFLCLALGQETPFVMDVIPMTWFFICACVYFIYHIILVYQSIKRICKASTFSSEAVPGGDPFSIYNCSDRVTNDIYDEALLENEKQGLEESSCPAKPTTKLKDLNYGFLRCYDNRNFCSSVFQSDEGKINFLQKKNNSKHEFIYTFMTKGNSITNNDKLSDLQYSRGFEAGSLTKECRNATNSTFVNNGSPTDTRHGCNLGGKMCSKPNNFDRSDDHSERVKKLQGGNLSFPKDSESEDLNIQLEQDDNNDCAESSNCVVNSVITRWHSLPSPAFCEESTIFSDETEGRETFNTRFVPKWVSNENIVYSNPLSSNNTVIPVSNVPNHRLRASEAQTENCAGRFEKHISASAMEEDGQAKSDCHATDDKFYSTRDNHYTMSMS